MAWSFDIPTWAEGVIDGMERRAASDQKKQRQAERDHALTRREVHGPHYELATTEQTQRGEPRHPHGVPEAFDRPSRIQILTAAPRALPVSQAVERGPEEGRNEAFVGALAHIEDRATMTAFYGLDPEEDIKPGFFRERRVLGRRHRATWNGDGPQQPPQRGGFQADVPQERYRSV